MSKTKLEEIRIKGDIARFEMILHWLPAIRMIISLGGTWEQLEAICSPLELSDTEFRENPTIKDYLVEYKFWKKRLKEAQEKLKK